VKRQPQFTHDIKFSDLQATTIMLNGVSYFQILLDVNEPNGAKSIIKLDELRLYTSQIGSQTTTNVDSLGTLLNDLDFYGDSQVIIDASRNHGSGSGDVNIYIPVEAFAGTSPDDYVYLYALFSEGNLKNNPDGTQGGFEEFALVRNITPIPELSSFFPDHRPDGGGVRNERSPPPQAGAHCSVTAVSFLSVYLSLAEATGDCRLRFLYLDLANSDGSQALLRARSRPVDVYVSKCLRAGSGNGSRVPELSGNPRLPMLPSSA